MKVLSTNKKAYFDYEIIETYEAGIVLLGTEVKSAKEGKINLRDSFVKIINGEAFLLNCHISPYSHGNITNHDPTRTRKLLLHRKELNKLIGKSKEKGLTLIPLKIYEKGNKIKVEISLAKAKRNSIKEKDIKEKDISREINRELKNRF